MNATDFFEKVQGDRSLPASSESFWTAIFALFLLHIASKNDELRVWKPTSTGLRPWYEPQVQKLPLSVLDFSGLAVEPCSVVDIWRDAGVDSTLGGISPDIVARISTSPNKTFLLIENKITSGATLNPNQISVYPRLIEFLKGRDDVRLLVLQSVGCSQRLYSATRFLRSKLLDKFGILLWEVVFRVMQTSGFFIHGLDTADLERFSADAATDCKDW